MYHLRVGGGSPEFAEAVAKVRRKAKAKAIGPHAAAAFTDAIWNDVMFTQPGRTIPMRSE